MRERRWRRENLFNPYIVLADVTIATIVIFVVLLISSETKGANVTKELKKYQATDHQRKELERKIRENNKAMTPAIREKSKKENWEKKKVYVSFSNGPNTFLIRIYGDGLWSHPSGNFGSDGTVRAKTVVEAIEAKCRDYLQGNPALIEVRIEGHCAEVAGTDRLELSLKRAKVVRKLFPEDLKQYISVSGLGSDRPAYETTPATIRKRLEAQGVEKSAEVLRRLEILESDEGIKQDLSEDAEIAPHLQEAKRKIADRIDIILVYSGLTVDNNFVFPKVETSTLPDTINDVSWPQPEKRFLKPPKSVVLP